ncbi:acyl-CoA dehydrogenase family protein [Pseudonocardia sp. NPDC049154]|uniref:acyl-CoA dehydrogenase family protein n=1 Tax=Pseudonocardia sp. NPDC049154 TaxID=3155501 RepID=UPI0033C9B72F
MSDFLDRARRFLDTHASPLTEPETTAADRIPLLPERPDPAEEATQLAAAKAWRAAEFDAGFGWLTGPVEYGGAGLDDAHATAYAQLRAGYRIPDQSVFGIGLGMVAPTLLDFGTPAARARWLRPLHRGEVVACQLFSEPDAGSDLSSLRTRARRDGAGWRVDGQKVWTTVAHLADVGLLLARTDPEAPRRQGISAFVVDMHAPGVQVRPLRQASGGASFNEVFLTDVWLSEDQLLGRENDGWAIARSTLSRERVVAGNAGHDLSSTVEHLTALVRASGRVDDPEIRARWAECYALMRVRALTLERAEAEGPGPETAMGKLTWTETLRKIAALAADLLGPAMTADTGAPGTFAWSEFALTVPGIRISAGTDEIVRTLLAERALGLPRDPAQ